MEIIDCHVHIGLSSFLKTAPSPERLKMHGFQYPLTNDPKKMLFAMDALRISKAVIFPFPFQEIDPAKANNFILDSAKKFSPRFYPVGLIHPDVIYTDNFNDFLGYKQHSVYQDFSPEQLTEVYQQMYRDNKILFIHLPFNNKVAYLERILRITPKLKIIVAHMGRKIPGTSIGVKEILYKLKKYENVIFDTSNIGKDKIVAGAINIVGEDRLCFGSDCPFGNQLSIEKNVEDELNFITNNNLKTSSLDKIFYQNISNFLMGV